MAAEKEQRNDRLIYWGVVLLGLAFILGGLVMAYQGWHTRQEVTQDLLNEKLEVEDPATLLTYPDARAPEGVEVPTVTIDAAQEAHDQSMVIRTHTLASTGGKTYSEMDREDPGRALYITSLTLQNSLHQAHLGLEITKLVIGMGVAFTGLGLGILVLGAPLTRKVLGL